MPTTTLTGEGIVLAATMIRRGGNRARLLSLVGQAPHDDQHFHALSTHRAGYLLGIGVRAVHELFVELVTAGVLERRPGAGSRPDAWRARGDVNRWRVEWPKRRGPDAGEWVRLILLEHGLLFALEPHTPEPLSRGPIAAREGIFARGPIAAREQTASRGSGTAREGPGLRAAIGPRESPSSSWSVSSPGRSPLTVVKKEEDQGGVSPYVRAVAAAIYRHTGRPVFGRGYGRLVRLEGRLELAGAEQALAVLPADAGWSMILAALEHAAELAAAAGPAEPPPDVWRVAVSWTNGGERPRVELRQCNGLEDAWSLVRALRAGEGWPAGASSLEVDDPIR